jgi:CRP-like cAMP-binding protein
MTPPVHRTPQAPRSPATAESFVGQMELMGAQMSFSRNAEIYGENEPADYLYKTVSGCVRTYKIFDDGRRQIGGFYFAGDVFGLPVFGRGHRQLCRAGGQAERPGRAGRAEWRHRTATVVVHRG